MITTSAGYKTNVKASSRQWSAKVDIYFDGEDSPATSLTAANISAIDFLEETQADGDNPLGRVSSNEIVLILNNKDYDFTPTYTSSPYYGKLIPNLKVEPYYGLMVSGSYEWISLGTYWTGDWDSPSQSVLSTVVCQDRLYKLGDKDVPLIPTQENLTRKAVFENFFGAIGLLASDFDVDATQTTVVPRVYYPEGKVRNCLSKLAEAFNCTVSMDRDNKIKVSNNRTVGASVITFSEDDMLKNVNIPQKFDNIYTDVDVVYSVHKVTVGESVLKIADVPVPAAGVTLSNLKFSKAPIAMVSYVKITKSKHISVGTLEIGSWGLSVQLVNGASADQTLDIEVFAYPLEITKNEVSVRDSGAYTLLGEEKALLIDNYLVQSSEEATTYANLILPIVTDPDAYVEADTRGDPSIELTDTITIDSTIAKIGTIEIIPIRFDYSNPGGLSCPILGIKKSAREGT